MMDDLFSKLRQGQDLGRKGQRRARRAHGERLLNISSKDANAGVTSPDAPGSAGSAGSSTSLDVDPALAARGMLAQMKGGDVSTRSIIVCNTIAYPVISDSSISCRPLLALRRSAGL